MHRERAFSPRIGGDTTLSTTAAIGVGVQPLSSGYHSTVPPQNGRGGSPLRVAAMVAASATATATASVVAMQDRQDIPAQFNQVNV